MRIFYVITPVIVSLWLGWLLMTGLEIDRTCPKQIQCHEDGVGLTCVKVRVCR